MLCRTPFVGSGGAAIVPNLRWQGNTQRVEYSRGGLTLSKHGMTDMPKDTRRERGGWPEGSPKNTSQISTDRRARAEKLLSKCSKIIARGDFRACWAHRQGDFAQLLPIWATIGSNSANVVRLCFAQHRTSAAHVLPKSASVGQIILLMRPKRTEITLGRIV